MVLKTSRREKGLSVHNRRRGAVKMDYIFAVALGVVILGAMVLAVVYGLGSKRPEKGNIDFHYKCDKCGEEFVTKEAPGPQERPEVHSAQAHRLPQVRREGQRLRDGGVSQVP